MRAEDIKDEESLRAWLETRPKADAVAIAHRAAMRVFPLWLVNEGDKVAKSTTHDIAFLCWASLLLRIEPTHRSAEVSYTKLGMLDSWSRKLKSASPAMLLGVLDAYLSSVFEEERYYAANVYDIARAIIISSSANLEISLSSTMGLIEEVRSDAVLLEQSENVTDKLLWAAGQPEFLVARDARILDHWSSTPLESDFWRRWWNGARDGKPLDWELQKRVALIPPEDWEKNDPTHIAALIRGIEDEFVRERTDNAETIAINPATGKLRLIPSTALPPNVSATARANIRAALALFGPVLNNQYRALEPARSRLETALRETPDLPVALFDACNSAVRITQGQARLGNLPTPEQDALIEDWLVQLRNSAADIYANDEGTRAAMANRGHVADDSALIAAQASVVEVVAPIVAQSEALLQAQLPEDAETATNPNADPEERRNAAFRLASRVLRVGWFVGKSVAAGAIGEVAVQILAPVFASKAWQLFRKAIWALLGLG